MHTELDLHINWLAAITRSDRHFVLKDQDIQAIDILCVERQVRAFGIHRSPHVGQHRFINGHLPVVHAASLKDQRGVAHLFDRPHAVADEQHGTPFCR
ncbi:hypothetical protein D3C72_1885090 [compost metagenome]